jgi:hypothetical protein
MNGLKRVSHAGFVISAAGHVGALVLGLLFVGAGAFKSMPPETKPPDAMLVDVVPPEEMPRLQGTPSDAMTSGSKSSSNSNAVSAAAQPPPPQPATPSRQQPQQPPSPPRDARQTAQSEMERAQAVLPLLPQSETGQVATAQPERAKSEPSPPQPQLTETPDQPDTSETFARLSLMGGRLGGGFEAPAIDSPVAAHDFRTVFLERVSSCSKMPAGIGIGDNIRVPLRVAFNPDGTLASPPQPAGAITSPEEAALMQSAISGLQKCQPYTMLPVDKYQEWKTLDLIFSPFSFLSR